MAVVTGSGYPDQDTFSRQGSGAGQFQRPGQQAQGLNFGTYFQNLLNNLTGNTAGSRVTGDVGAPNANVTYGGGGRGSGAGASRATAGKGGMRVTAPTGPGLQNAAGMGLGLGATALGLAPGAISTFQEQGLVPGLASTAAGLGTAALTSGISGALMKGPLPLKLAGGALQLFAPAAAQAGTAGLFGAAEKGKTGAGGADVSIPATPLTGEIPASDAARERLQRQRDLEYEAQRTQTLGTAQLGVDRQALQDQVNSYIQLQKSLQPLTERTMRQQLVNQQALINTQSAAYQTLGRQAGMFRLAGQGMTEAGATMRTAISANPYAGATLQAPSISFG
jgi:hypothetical protein